MTADTDLYRDAVGKLINYVDQTVAFASGELPEVCKEILLYGAVQNVFWCWFSGAFFALAITMFVWGLVRVLKGDGDWTMFVLFTFMFMLVTGGLFGMNVMQGEEIRLAPKLYVIEYLRYEAARK